MWKLWANLENAVREGTHRWKQTFGWEGPIFANFFRNEETKREFLIGMHGFSLLSSPPVVAAFDLAKYRCLVDVGGATGHLAIAACHRYPQLRAVVFDLTRWFHWPRKAGSGGELTKRSSRGLAKRGYRRPTGAACAPGHEGAGGADVALTVSGCCLQRRAGGLVLLLACAAASESATELPLAFAIHYPANGLTARGAAVACQAAARLRNRLMAPRPVAQGSWRKNCCRVTTRRPNLRRLRRLWRRRDALTAHAFGLGMLGFGRLVLAPLGRPLRRLPTPHQPQAFGILAVMLIPTPRLVLASTAFAQADARPRSSATAVWLIMTMAHGSAFSQGTARGERA